MYSMYTKRTRENTYIRYLKVAIDFFLVPVQREDFRTHGQSALPSSDLLLLWLCCCLFLLLFFIHNPIMIGERASVL